MRRYILLICSSSMQPVVLGRKSMLSVVLSHEKALPNTFVKAQICHVDSPITASILLPRRRRYTLGTARRVYGSRYMSGCHDKISRDTHFLHSSFYRANANNLWRRPPSIGGNTHEVKAQGRARALRIVWCALHAYHPC